MSLNSSVRGCLLLLAVAAACKTAPPARQSNEPAATMPAPSPAPTRTPVSEQEKQRRRLEKEAAKRDEHRKQLASVNVISNPDAVKTCQKLKAFDESEQAERSRDDQVVLDALRQDVLGAGGNTLLLSPDGLHGEAYQCSAGTP